MKLAIYSDIHLEFTSFDPPNLAADVVILAGDIGTGDQGVKWAQSSFSQPVVYVFGNHEFYRGHCMRTLTKCLNTYQGSNVNILERNAVVIKGVRFLGCTLWSDFRISDKPYNSMQLIEFEMNDYRKIRTGSGYRKLRGRDTLGIHQESVIWLKQRLEEPFDGHTVVVTHHAPHPNCINRKKCPEYLDGAYVSDISELIQKYQPALWVHGHTHKKVDFWIGRTRIVSNPRGYVTANACELSGFDSSFVVSL